MKELINKIAVEKEKLVKLTEEFNNESDVTISENLYRRLSLKEKYIKGLEDALEILKG